MADHPPTMQDIADAAKVGKSTVSLALRDDPRLKAETRAHIQKVAAELGYRANPVVANLMAQLRASRTPKYQATLALLNAATDPHHLQTVFTFRHWVEGCGQRAAQLGYSIDGFWLGDPALPPDKLARVLDSRGIRGVLLAAVPAGTGLPQPLRPLWERFACVVIGAHPIDPPLHFAISDQYATTYQAVGECLNLGYRRPGLVIDSRIEELVDFRFNGGFAMGVRSVAQKNRVPALDLRERKLPVFEAWLKTHKPDVILTLHEEVMIWLEELMIPVPGDVGFVHLDLHDEMPGWAGMDQNSRLVGSAALDMVVAQLHRNEFGVPAFPKCIQIESRWVPGESVRPQKSRA